MTIHLIEISCNKGYEIPHVDILTGANILWYHLQTKEVACYIFTDCLIECMLWSKRHKASHPNSIVPLLALQRMKDKRTAPTLSLCADCEAQFSCLLIKFLQLSAMLFTPCQLWINRCLKGIRKVSNPFHIKYWATNANRIMSRLLCGWSKPPWEQGSGTSCSSGRNRKRKGNWEQHWAKQIVTQMASVGQQALLLGWLCLEMGHFRKGTG